MQSPVDRLKDTLQAFREELQETLENIEWYSRRLRQCNEQEFRLRIRIVETEKLIDFAKKQEKTSG